jgi:GNAT superfamily N-acetyltransferase
MKQTLKKLTLSNLDDFTALFEGETCETCQCTFYYAADNIDQWMKMTLEETKALRKTICNRTSDGYLYYVDDQPAAWCQCVPPDEFPYLKRLLSLENATNCRVISCFFVGKGYRGRGILKKMLGDVIEACTVEGVEVLYGIPVHEDFLARIEPERKNEKMHTGLKEWFEDFDFQQVGENGRYYFMELK